MKKYPQGFGEAKKILAGHTKHPQKLKNTEKSYYLKLRILVIKRHV
jgi:hypothetical protein